MNSPYLHSSAILSDDRKHRFVLHRCWGDPSRRCVFVGLNPSTADERNDDPTIRKCVGFATRWGFGAIDMVNLFSIRSTDPDALIDLAGDLNRAESDGWLRDRFATASRIVLAWGAHAKLRQMIYLRAFEVRGFLPINVEVGDLGKAKGGAPRHPLMLPYVTPFMPRESSCR
jgi:hypothetical protein